MKQNENLPRPVGDIIRQYLLTDNSALAKAWRRRKKIKRPCKDRGAPEITGT